MQKIMIVEDQPLVALFYAFSFREAGFEVVEYSNAEDALSYLAADHVDGIVTDVDLGPGMTGLELLRQLRASGATTPVIVTSGLDAVDLPAGVTLVSKPCNVADLVADMTRMIGPRARAAA